MLTNYLAECAALAAATCWAFTGVISTASVRYFGPMAFNRYRIVFAALLLLGLASWFGSWHTLPSGSSGILALSGVVGIFMGDTALMMALARLGPRRTVVLFSTNAPIAAALGFWLLQETIPLTALLGCGIVLTGVLVVILLGQRQDDSHNLEQTTGSLGIGVLLGLLAALGQAVGAVMVKPVLLAGGDPIAVSAVRVAFAALCLLLLRSCKLPWIRARNKPTGPHVWRTLTSSFIGMVVGMTLLVYALRIGEIGIVTTLSATTPVVILPMVWLATGQRPNRWSWLGAIIVVLGSALIFLG